MSEERLNKRDQSRIKKLAGLFEKCTSGKGEFEVLSGLFIKDAAYMPLKVACPDIKAKQVPGGWLIKVKDMQGRSKQIREWLHEHPELKRIGDSRA